MALWEFRQLLAARRISPHYDAEDLEEDVQTLRRLGRVRSLERQHAAGYARQPVQPGEFDS